MSHTIARFVESPCGGLSALEVESQCERGALAAIAGALYRIGVQVRRIESRVSGERSLDRFYLVEPGEPALSADRRLEIQQAILAAVDHMVRRPRYLASSARRAAEAQ